MCSSTRGPASEHERDATLLGKTRELRGTLAHLSHRPGCRGECLRVERLDRVDHGDVGSLGGEGCCNAFELDLGQQQDAARVDRQTTGTQRHLLARLLATDVERTSTGTHGSQRLQQERRLADARVTPDEYHLTRHDAPTEHPVEFLDTAVITHGLQGLDIGQTLERRRFDQTAGTVRSPGSSGLLEQGVPFIAARALTQPTRALGAAGRAHVERLGACRRAHRGSPGARRSSTGTLADTPVSSS